MSTRRRIKAAAILPPKRSARDVAVKCPGEPETKKSIEKIPVDNKSPADIQSPNDIFPKLEPKEIIQQNVKKDPSSDQQDLKVCPEQAALEVFKSPPVVTSYNRADSSGKADIEIERSDDSYMKICSQGPPSPVKFRQRIRPTPFFGMRRNSTQGNGSDVEEEPKRQRHTSTSSNTGPPTPQRMRPPTAQRIRTESSCSNISDYIRDNNTKASRKNPSDETSRLNASRKDFLTRFSGRVPEKSAMKMSDLIYYNPVTNPMIPSDPQIPSSATDTPVTKVEPVKNENPKSENTCMPVPQLKLGPDGEMIVDEQSLVIETTAEKEARETLANTKVIYMDEFSGNNGFYRRSKRTKDWPSEETIKFYRCLHTVGTDFSLMLTLFPNRTRRELKLKFKKEERTNLTLINKALLFPKAFNVAELKQELDKEQEEHDAHKKELEESKKAEKANRKAKKKTTYNSRTANILSDGDLAYEQPHELPKHSAPKRKKSNHPRNERKCKNETPKKFSKKKETTPLCDNEFYGQTQNNEILNSDQSVNSLQIENPSVCEPQRLDATESGEAFEPANVLPASICSMKEAPLDEPMDTTESDICVYTNSFSTDLKRQSSSENRNLLSTDNLETLKPQYNITNNNQVLPLLEASTSEMISLNDNHANFYNIDSAHTKSVSHSKQEFSIADKEYLDSTETTYLELKPQLNSAVNIQSKIESTLDIVKISHQVKSEPCPKESEIVEVDQGKTPNPISIEQKTEVEDVEHNICIQEANDESTSTEPPQHSNESSIKADTDITNSKLKNENHINEEALIGCDINSDLQVKDIDAEMERFMLNDLGAILTNLVNGSLVVVASEDENDPTRMINEIYVMNKETGVLSESPLDLAEDIVNCIVEELSMT